MKIRDTLPPSQSVDVPTLAMLRCALGDEIPEQLYRPLVFLLAQGMSIRGLADFLQSALGVNYYDALQHVNGSLSGGEKALDPKALSEVKSRLFACGYEKWLQED
jgi:hypothetical protein